MENNELYHYGVKGMKWGVRRYQNKDGTLTNAGKKQLAIQIKKQYPKNATNDSYTRLINDISDDLSDNYKSQLNEQIDNIREKRKFRDKVSKIESEYYSSKQYKNDKERAYKETYDWFEKNEPDYLQSIIKKNNGDKKTLVRYHDFDTMYDGFADKALSDGLNHFYRKNGVDPTSAYNAYNNYINACRSAANDVVGRYGKMRVPKEYSYEKDTTVNDLITAALRTMSGEYDK